LTVQAQDGYSYQIDEVKIFLNYFTDKSVYSENLVFEGSDDGVSWTTIIQYDENIHEGWNSNVYRDSASPPDYPYLRFVGSAKNSCKIGEIKIIGVEVINNDSSSINCTPVLTINGVESSLTSVTYSNSQTPLLTSIYPRYGSEYGGTSVTFTGTNFDSTATTEILIDDKECLITSQSTTAIVCETTARPYTGEAPKLSFT
jgi:hypothetical protein